MTFILRREHLAIHEKMAKQRQCQKIAKQLDLEYPEQFITQVNNDPLGWTKKAVTKAKKYDFDGDDEEILYEFCRVLVFIGLDFDKNKMYPEIVGIFHDNPDYVPYPLTKLEQIEWIDDQLESQINSSNDTRNK